MLQYNIVHMVKRIIRGIINRLSNTKDSLFIEISYLLNRKELKHQEVSKRSYYIIKEWDKRHSQMMKRAQKKGFRVANKDSMVKYKTSDTLFILGSGPSINDITDEQWAHIGSCDSFGLNWFLVHPFTPTFYHMELSSKNIDLFKFCYSKKRSDFKEIPMMLNMRHLPKDILLNDLNYINNLYVTVPVGYAGAGQENLKEILHHHYFNKPMKAGTFIHYRASLTLALSFGLSMGYKKIIMTGVDMDSNDYFFFNEDIYNDEVAEKVRVDKKSIINNYLRSKITPGLMHRTADPFLFNELPLDQVIPIFNEVVLKPRQIELYLLSSKSILYPRIGLYSY